MAKITAFKVGYCTHKACMTVRGAGFKTIQCPARAFLIEAGEDRWLWDTGYSSHFFDATKSMPNKIYLYTTPAYFKEEEALLHQLNSIGLNNDDITGLIISHFHGDHIAGLKDFKQIPYICHGRSWQKIRQYSGVSAVRRAFLPQLIPADFDARARFIESFKRVELPAELQPFSEGYILPNSNGEVILVELPGHAIGQIGAFISTDSGWELIASDAAWSMKNYRDKQLPSVLTRIFTDDPTAFIQTINKLHLLDSSRKVKIHLSHEDE